MATPEGTDLDASAAVAEREAERLRDRLAQLELEQATLEAEIAAFNADYLRSVGVVMAQLHDVEARLLSLAAQRSGTRGDAEAAQTAAARARRTTAAAAAVPPPAGPAPTGDLKKRFREAAKRMHPDLAADAETRGHAEAFMKRLNDAYRAGDGDAIADLVRQWESSPYSAAAHDEVARSVRAVRRVGALQSAVERAERRLEEVRSSELAQMMERAMASAVRGGDLLGELRAAAEAALADARVRLMQHGGYGGGA